MDTHHFSLNSNLHFTPRLISHQMADVSLMLQQLLPQRTLSSLGELESALAFDLWIASSRFEQFDSHNIQSVLRLYEHHLGLGVQVESIAWDLSQFLAQCHNSGHCH
ncbi:hypothetical protein [Ferrimonas aestuarii]|uniref:Uncharacterized protein n=1 Tax=Ferrimonas aestuarii TaxID=2569539 RepID=A0A4U1BMW9_9GAMM|nr:hypothetical protein [Ferrimonas aestuarii]TKB52774.1 hypothetical protein FCL42_15810 [Ferrimonas aestuarii]